MKILIFAAIWILCILAMLSMVSCTKELPYEEDRDCHFARLISDKYTADSVFVVRDTLWTQTCLSQYWLDKEKEAALTADGLFKHCNPFVREGKVVRLEIWTHVWHPNQQLPIKKFK